MSGRSIFLYGLLLIAGYLNGQKFIPLDVDIRLNSSGMTVKYPQMGNLAAPQFSQTDIDGDGLLDLFVFDRQGDAIIPLINEGSAESPEYDYRPDLISAFPQGMHSWALIRDYNKDGIGDVFTAPSTPGIPGIEVFQGMRNNGNLSYTRLTFDNSDFDVLEHINGNSSTIIYNVFTDIPGIEDLDGDGDLDIVTFNPEGSLAVYYKNQSVERGFETDTFIYMVEDNCWGKFKEDEFSSVISLSTDAATCSAGLRTSGNTRHSGSTLTFPDIDGDGVFDLLLGDLTSNKISLLSNGGNQDQAWMNRMDGSFPSYETPIDIADFTATYLIDLNNDGKKELIAAPNYKLTNQSTDFIWLYDNIGADTSAYQLRSKNFIVNDALILGAHSHPCLFDSDFDGDLDLIVGVSGLANEFSLPIGTIYHFENKSIEDKLIFELTDDNYLNIQNLNTQSGRYAPTVGDLDGDGDLDMMIGDLNGKLIYFENTAGPGEIPSFPDFVYNYKNIGVGQNAKPQIIDVDLDGLNDLVVGERNDNKRDDILGGVNFFKNVGTPSVPDFNPDLEEEENTPVLSGMFTRDAGFSVGSSAPFLLRTEDDLIAMVGSESGKVKYYDNLQDNIYGTAPLQKDNMLPYLLGTTSTIIGGDLNGNEFVDFVVGSNRGNVTFFESTLRFNGTTSIGDNIKTLDFAISPNPSKGLVRILTEHTDIEIQIFDPSGRMILKTTDKQIVLPGSGVYLVRLLSEDRVSTKKVIVLD